MVFLSSGTCSFVPLVDQCLNILRLMLLVRLFVQRPFVLHLLHLASWCQELGLLVPVRPRLLGYLWLSGVSGILASHLLVSFA